VPAIGDRGEQASTTEPTVADDRFDGVERGDP
jgi:hypothetical protein